MLALGLGIYYIQRLEFGIELWLLMVCFIILIASCFSFCVFVYLHIWLCNVETIANHSWSDHLHFPFLQKNIKYHAGGVTDTKWIMGNIKMLRNGITCSLIAAAANKAKRQRTIKFWIESESALLTKLAIIQSYHIPAHFFSQRTNRRVFHYLQLTAIHTI